MGLASRGGTVEGLVGQGASSSCVLVAWDQGSVPRRLLLFLKAPSTLRGVLLYLVAEGHPPSSHLCDDF